MALVLLGCAPSTTPSTSSSVTAGTVVEAPQLLSTLDLEEAIALRVVAGRDGSAWVTWSESDGVRVAWIDLNSGELVDPVEVSGAEGVFAHPIERPAMEVSGDGSANVAWISELGDVRLAALGSNGEVSESQSISGEVRPETVLVHMTATDIGLPVLSWLEDSTLSVAFGDSSGEVIERELVDDRTCDCCHPVPIVMGDQVGVGYRNAATADGRIVRDIHFVTGSLDHGFGDSVAIADEHWFLEACPFSGPSLTVADGGVLVAAWMDGRQSIHPDQDATSIWIDRSFDGGVTFGLDHRLTIDQAIHRSPSLATGESGELHLIWERRTPEAATIEYTTSADGGSTWRLPEALIEADSGAPREASLAILNDRLLVSWADNDGGHVGIWQIP